MPSLELDIARAIDVDPDIDRDGGREFKSGAMVGEGGVRIVESLGLSLSEP